MPHISAGWAGRGIGRFSARPYPHHDQQTKPDTKIFGNHRGQRHATDVHFKADHENQIEHDIDTVGGDLDEQRRAWLLHA